MIRQPLYLTALLLTLAFALPASAQLAVSSVDVRPGANGAEEVVFVTNGEIPPKKIFALTNPDRAVIDLPLVNATNITLPPDYRGTLIRSMRFGQFSKDTSRIVLDLAGPSSITTAVGASSLTVSLKPLGLAATSQASPFTALQGGVPASPVVSETKKPLIVIDAGHGGQDPGALGGRKTQEKDFTLSYARALKDGLLRTGRYRVALTRDDDRFIRLGDRVAIARRLKGDIFISLHADSNPKLDAQGLSIYTLSETASDDEAEALAERENKADIIPGINLNGADADVASILIDLTQRETMNKSAELADTVVASLHSKITRLPKTHRFAGFRVLKATDIPSVLVELGFLSHVDDEKRLASLEYQSLVVSSIINGVDRYLALKKL
jgi:N-acetylmuramoyl-L-alanine amidase